MEKHICSRSARCISLQSAWFNQQRVSRQRSGRLHYLCRTHDRDTLLRSTAASLAYVISHVGRQHCTRRWQACKAQQQHKGAAGSQHVSISPSGPIWTALYSTFLAAGPALAEEGLKYDPGTGADVVKKVAGAAYVVLLAVFAVRLLSKRARSATEERITSTGKEENERPVDPSTQVITPLQALWAAVQAGGFAYLLFLFTSTVDGYFDGQQLPDQYTARNITITIRTIVRGLAYLCTFIFAANAVGLGALTVQLLVNPELDAEADAQQGAEDISDSRHEGSSGDAL
ncbi:hypothetical protein COCOBI_06-5500 [Coccomyxa sp. Obi]|nr:hypothetical protein COCOBI_06-5500 [Coccomyxa sp. Obi]